MEVIFIFGGSGMKHILLGYIIENKSTKCKIYTLDDKFLVLSGEELFRQEKQDRVNYDIKYSDRTGWGIISKHGGRQFKLDTIQNGKVLENIYTLIDIDKKSDKPIKLITIDEKKLSVSIEDYIKLNAEQKTNNGIIKEFLYDKKVDRILYLGFDKKSIILESRQISNQTSIAETADKKAEESDKNKDLTYRINRCKDIIWNMYPLNSVTIQEDEFNGLSTKILKVLDSDLDGNVLIALTIIYKQTRQKCTFTLIKKSSAEKNVIVQVLGQSDIPEKALKTDLEKVCSNYAAWLRNTKYIKI